MSGNADSKSADSLKPLTRFVEVGPGQVEEQNVGHASVNPPTEKSSSSSTPGVETNPVKLERDKKRGEEELKESHAIDSQNKKPRKKRRTFSCDTCRKFKTRCDFEPLLGKCHRCGVLNIDCSLTKEREDEIISAIETSSTDRKPKSKPSSLHRKETSSNKPSIAVTGSASESGHPLVNSLNDRLSILERSFNNLNSKIDLIVLLLQGSTTAASNANNLLSTHRQGSHDTVDNALNENTKPPSSIKPSVSSLKKNINTELKHNETNQNTASSKIGNNAMVPFSNLSNKNSFSEGFKLREYPAKLIDDIDERLFPSKPTSKQEKIAQEQRPEAVARAHFMIFYEKHRSLCHKLSKEFLVRSHFWIIPGGVKDIDSTYVRKNLFITSVFTIIAMSFADNDKFAEEQEMLYPLVERFLTNTLTMFEKLTDHDIEAILYCCMFHISKKAKRHRQLKFNSLVLSNFALFSLLNNIDFHKIKERVLYKEEYNSTDLYHLRILNSLTACHLENSITHGTIRPQDATLKEFNNLVAKFPQANFGDDIKISQINLGDILVTILMDFRDYFKNFKTVFLQTHALHSKTGFATGTLLVFPELDYWLKNWEELLAKDGGGVLLFTFDFYHIMICRSFIAEFLEDMNEAPDFLRSVLFTIKEHAFSLLKGVLRLPPTLLRGAPILTMNELVYACLTLGDFLHWFDSTERQQILSICTEVYWHLNTIGEKLNEVTENVGKIIKSIITISKSKINTLPTLLSKVSKPSALSNVSNIDQPSKNDQKKKPEAPHSNGTSNKVELLQPGSPDSNMSHHSRASSTADMSQSIGQFTIPDVDQFNSFEDFFQEFFDHLKPNTQRLFSARK
ncbi:hypothetical protein KAFR_0G01220 [Kazachstania africana CBS 2517]|uniref:Zn(2)-C6 fungal-type domain-containing protein n=1 Tax=Kazachstania africana (strain ATCC 22294 / BCRC 22015 / CBS 2517 / CECT 1963 / NBRC 1671 / NRRL Y-8276) TaxID=1071382 RepID=H2AXQ6_KAZAF|nr:hypothetical protein KAFR_0G01220 [Kazachstania africana CBS 2517]CCF59156.1 hypothetical protein KAFR_0G01220 [Kazachstania africana CBS 2517]